MTKKWFNLKEVTNVEELKQAFKKLVFKWHPDVTKKDTTQEMKEINSEYDELVKKLPKSATNSKTMNDNEINDGFKEVLVKIVNLPDLDIEICGSWVWVGGNTYAVKNELKNAGFKFATKKKLWYWRTEENGMKFNRKSVPMDVIREVYGSEKVNSKQTEKIKEAN